MQPEEPRDRGSPDHDATFMTEKPIPFPLRAGHNLSFDQCVSVAQVRVPQSGLIIGYDEDGDIFIFNFGLVSRKEALWLSEQLRRHAFGESIS